MRREVHITDGVIDIVLRRVREDDKAVFLALQEENVLFKSMMKNKSYRELLWKEHLEPKALMFSIIADNAYAGYCGIKNTTQERWEIAIELLEKWRHKGIGYKAICIMLDEIKNSLNVSEFRVKISSDNYASQALFEKLGAIPYGISEFMLHKKEDIEQCEKENAYLIDDAMIKVANKFKVEPKKLLSHVLEYKLVWKEN